MKKRKYASNARNLGTSYRVLINHRKEVVIGVLEETLREIRIKRIDRDVFINITTEKEVKNFEDKPKYEYPAVRKTVQELEELYKQETGCGYEHKTCAEGTSVR